MKNFVSSGRTLDLTAPSGGVVSGSPVKIGGFIAVPRVSAAEGDVFAADVEGVYDVKAEGAGSGQAWAEGDVIYWDNTAKQFTKTTTSNTKAGHATRAKLTADVAGQIRLCPFV